jgi:cell division protein FtsZ
MTPEQVPPSANGVVKPLVVRVFGVGGAGCSAVEHMNRNGLAELAPAALHTNARVLEGHSLTEKFLLGARLTRGLGTGGDPESGKAVALEEAERLRALCAGVDLVILVAGLGGGTGTGVTPHLAKIA